MSIIFDAIRILHPWKVPLFLRLRRSTSSLNRMVRPWLKCLLNEISGKNQLFIDEIDQIKRLSYSTIKKADFAFELDGEIFKYWKVSYCQNYKSLHFVLENVWSWFKTIFVRAFYKLISKRLFEYIPRIFYKFSPPQEIFLQGTKV